MLSPSSLARSDEKVGNTNVHLLHSDPLRQIPSMYTSITSPISSLKNSQRPSKSQTSEVLLEPNRTVTVRTDTNSSSTNKTTREHARSSKSSKDVHVSQGEPEWTLAKELVVGNISSLGKALRQRRKNHDSTTS